MARIPFALANPPPRSGGLPTLGIGAAVAPAQALQEAGADLVRVGLRRQAELDEALEKQQRLADANGVTQAISAAQKGLAERFDAWSSANDATDPGFTERWTEQADGFLQDVINQAVGQPDQRRISEPAEAELKARIEGFGLAYWEKSLNTQRAAQGKAAQDAWGVFENEQAALVMRDPGLLDTALGTIDDLALRYVGADGVSENALRDAAMKTRSTTIVAAVQGALDKRDLRTARGILGDERFNADLDAGKRGVLNNAIETTARQIKAEQRAAAAEFKADLRARFVDVKERAGAGFNTNPGELEALKRGFAAVGDQERAVDVAALMQAQGTLDQLRRGTPAQVRGYVNDLHSQIAEQGGEPTRAQLQTLTMAEKLYGTMGRLATDDPLTLAAQTGNAAVPALVFEGETAKASLESRVGVAEAVGEYYGIQPKYLTAAERDQLAARLADPNPERVLGLVATLNEAFGSRANLVLAEIAPKEPALAHVGGLALIDQPRASSALSAVRGRAAAAAGNKVAFDEVQAREVEAEVIGGALQTVPQTRGAGIAVARDIYTDRMVRLGRGAEAFDADEYAASLQLALGADAALGDEIQGGLGTGPDGERLVLPSDRTQSQFETVINGLTDQDLVTASVGGGVPSFEDGTSLTAEELRDHARLEDAGDGIYRVRHTITDAYLRGTGQGGLYEIDLKAIAPRVLAREKK
jgi:hypothetical protein